VGIKKKKKKIEREIVWKNLPKNYVGAKQKLRKKSANSENRKMRYKK
jgi:hypothetical protein